MSAAPPDSPPPSPSQPNQLLPVPSSTSDGLPSPTTSHSDESGPVVGELANLSDAPSSDWTGSDEESDQDEHDFDMVASIDLSEAGSLGHRSTASSSGSGPAMNKMKLSYPNPLTTNEEVEPDSMDDYQPDSAYSFLHDASESPAAEAAPTDAGSVATDDTSSTSDKASTSVVDVRKAETSKWVETAAGNSPKKERRRLTLISLAMDDKPTKLSTPAVLFPDVNASVVVPEAFSISQHTESGSTASSMASIKSSDSNATIVSPKLDQLKPLYSQVVAEGVPDEPAVPAAQQGVLVEDNVKVNAEATVDEKQPLRAEDPPKATRGPSHLVTRSLIVLATILAISTVKLIESVPSFAELKSHTHSTALSTSLVASPPIITPALNSAPSNPALSGTGWTSSSVAHQASPSALAVVPSDGLRSAEPADSADDDDDWIDEEEVLSADFLEMISIEEAQEREGFEIDESEDSLDDADEEADEEERAEAEDDREDDFFDTLLGGIGAPDLVEHVNGFLGAVEDTLSPCMDSFADAWRTSLGQIPARFSQAKHAHRHLRHRGRKAIGRRVRWAEQHGAELAATWLGAPARKVQVAWSQTTDTAKVAVDSAEHVWVESKQLAGQAWVRAAEPEPEWTKRQTDESWSLLGEGSVWKGLARRGVQGERFVRSPSRMGGLLGKSFKRAREITHEVDSIRRREASKHKRTAIDKLRRWREAVVHDRQGSAEQRAEV